MGMETFLARQPIVDAEHRLFAYELLFRQSMASVSAQISSQLQAGVGVISNTLCLGPDWLLQGKLAFINLDEATLMSDFVCLLPPQHVVYEILETVPVSSVLIARIRELRQLGYRFALDDFVCLEEYRPLLPMVDFKWAYLGRYSLTTGITPQFGGIGLSRHIDDMTLFQNLEIQCIVGPGWDTKLYFGVGLRTNF